MDMILMELNGDISEYALQEMTFQLSKDLQSEGFNVVEKNKENESGKRGDFFEAGKLFLAFAGTGTSIAIINCLRAFLSRDKSLTLKIQKKDISFELTAENISTMEAGKFIESLIKLND